VFSQYMPGQVPEDFSLSKFAGLKAWFVVYRRSIFLGGGMGIGVVLLTLLIMRACGGDSPPPPAAAPPDADEIEIKMAPPVDASPMPPADAKHSKH
jgi:hypothetical protein